MTWEVMIVSVQLAGHTVVNILRLEPAMANFMYVMKLFSGLLLFLELWLLISHQPQVLKFLIYISQFPA